MADLSGKGGGILLAEAAFFEALEDYTRLSGGGVAVERGRMSTADRTLTVARNRPQSSEGSLCGCRKDVSSRERCYPPDQTRNPGGSANCALLNRLVFT